MRRAPVFLFSLLLALGIFCQPARASGDFCGAAPFDYEQFIAKMKKDIEKIGGEKFSPDGEASNLVLIYKALDLERANLAGASGLMCTAKSFNDTRYGKVREELLVEARAMYTKWIPIYVKQLEAIADYVEYHSKNDARLTEFSSEFARKIKDFVEVFRRVEV